MYGKGMKYKAEFSQSLLIYVYHLQQYYKLIKTKFQY